MRYYYLYEIKINNPQSELNGCCYYGKHSTSNLEDNYFGSGKIIKRYQNKYGKTGLIKTILEFFSSEEELNKAEYLLVKEKKEELKDKCLNLNDGGSGSFTYLNSLYTSEERSQIMLSTSTKEERIRRATIGGLANKKRLEDPENLADFKQKMVEYHANLSEERKKEIYQKSSESLKKYYQTEEGKIEKEQRKLKNKETNKKVSAEWRAQFKSLFRGKSPESFRKYGKQKESYDLFKKIKDLSEEKQYEEVDNFFRNIENN